MWKEQRTKHEKFLIGHLKSSALQYSVKIITLHWTVLVSDQVLLVILVSSFGLNLVQSELKKI